ncbi:MAG TPA: ATP synthase F1 subunit gamma [Phycisphaerae bacterium]|jgi:F-type H+-transporting ATPase subunit gamma
MAKARAIVKRRKSVRNIKKITHTMQLIATARFQKALQRAVATKPYTQKITELVGQLSAAGGSIEHPLLKVNRGANRVAVLVLTSNRGLCGGYNASLLRTAGAHLQDVRQAGTGIDLNVVGKKGIAYYKFLGTPVARAYAKLPDAPQFADVEPLADGFIKAYSAGVFDAVYVTYVRFVSTVKQVPTVMQLLPIAQEEPPTATAGSRGPRREVQYDFSPSPQELLAELLPQTIKVRLFQSFCDATVSEQVARMVAMKAATDAAGDMIKQLSRQYNRARQSQITMELLDILGGVEALK